jgi:hypothetical protein
MNKEFYKMRKLAGLITESQYQQLLEDQSIIDKILDKISAQGIDSLTPEEKEYLDTNGESSIPTSGETIVYRTEPSNTGLYKIENFPAVPNAKSVYFDCGETDTTSCEQHPEMVPMLKNKKFKDILSKINNYLNQKYPQFGDSYFHGITFKGDFSSPIDVAYIQVSGDSIAYVVDSLDRFSSGYQTEEDWRVKNWVKL